MAQRSTPISRVRSLKLLREAWQVVYRSGHLSRSPDIQRAIAEFALDAEGNLDRLQRRLARGKFKFSPSIGVLKKRKGKEPRPIVVAPVEDRIVQRSILEVLTKIPAVKHFVENSSSFGGLRSRGVKQAISAVCYTIQEGATFFIRSDIGGFFRAIPRGEVLSTVASLVRDESFCDLLGTATVCELSNLQELGKYSELFPTAEIGISQGCCLSPLLGNILLEDFDKTMNGRGLRCFRYIDDFIIMGYGESKVKKGFESAQKILRHLGLQAYDPVASPEKAQMGVPHHGFDFLGCSISDGRVSPSEKAQRRLIDGVRERLQAARMGWDNSNDDVDRSSLIEGLWLLDKFLQAWGNQYSFCNNEKLWDSLDMQVDNFIGRHIDFYRRSRERLGGELSRVRRRRLLGVCSLTDCNREPIFPLMRMASPVNL